MLAAAVGNGCTMKQVSRRSQNLDIQVCNLAEAELIAAEFDAVISLVPSTEAALRSHTNRCCTLFDDVVFADDRNAPTSSQVHEILRFASTLKRSVLVHCLYGQSRSTAVALSIMAARGVDPSEAYRHLEQEHPPQRPFTPNVLVLSLFDHALQLDGELVRAGTTWVERL
jgi:predicted protein tyrosine phosphatase